MRAEPLATQADVPMEDQLQQPNLFVRDILRDLVNMPTVTSDRAMNNKALDYINHFVQERGMFVEQLEWNGIRSLVATTRKTKTPTVFLMGHIDVVPASEDEFSFQEREGRYYGRGVLDMKGGIAAYLAAIDALRDNLSSYDFGLMIVSDEETGGFSGAAKLVEAGYLPKVMVIMDGTPGWNMEYAAKGIWHITIEAHGKSAHGSRPWAGENAVDKVINAIRDIKEHFPELHAKSNTVSVGMIRGGQAINQVPAHATAGIDIRFMSRDEYTRIRIGVEAALKRHGVTICEEVYGDTMENDTTNPYLLAFKDSTETVIGQPIEWVMSKAANDGRWFSGKGVPCAVSYPDGSGHHSANEWISSASLGQMKDIFVSFLNKVARQ
jgi:succinyl-diaminopimelate desuccinylase